MIAHVVARLASVPGVAGIVVAVAPEDPWWEEAAAGFDAPVVRVDGGAERRDSVANALNYVRTAATDDALVMVHDAVRPCTAATDFERALAAARGHSDGAILAAPVTDTLKRAGPEGRIGETVVRDRLWRAFTPQVFPLGALHAALASAIARGAGVTDEAQALEQAGARPHLVESSADNVKITHPGDLALAEALLDAGWDTGPHMRERSP